jgi:hypothetical protein
MLNILLPNVLEAVMEIEIGKRYYLDIEEFAKSPEGEDSHTFCEMFRKTNRMVTVADRVDSLRFEVDEEYKDKMDRWGKYFTVGNEEEFIKFLHSTEYPPVALLELEIIGLDAE